MLKKYGVLCTEDFTGRNEEGTKCSRCISSNIAATLMLVPGTVNLLSIHACASTSATLTGVLMSTI